jgi:hypothetical protein
LFIFSATPSNTDFKNTPLLACSIVLAVVDVLDDDALELEEPDG